MAFKGMDPDQGRQVASQIEKAGHEIEQLFTQLTSQVKGVQWEGPDFHHFTAEWDQFINSRVHHVQEEFAKKATDLKHQAEEQDSTSNKS